jgi:hypothetical protein
MIPAIIVGAHLAVAVADRPPVVNFEQTCREETTGDLRMKDKFEVCVADEKRARDQLTGQWSSFDPAARTRCVRMSTGGHAPSYLELLVCLELDQADREVRGSGSYTGITSTEPGRPAGERDEATGSTQSQPAPVAAPSRPAPVAVPSRPAPIPRSPQQSVARSAAAPPAAPPPAEPLPLSPSPPVSAPEPTSAEVLQQSLCRSPLGYVLPSCR